MGDSRYQRVSRKRPCRICGKPDWCSRTGDDSISFCARVTAGADRLSRRERWGVFYHDRTLLDNTFWQKSEPHQPYKKQTKEIYPAPLEIRDFIYASLLRLSPASNYDCLTSGHKGLRTRGLENFEDYGALPCSASDRKDLAAQVRLLLYQNYSSFVRENPCGLAHIPGFWINESGEACLWLEKNFSRPMLLIPYRNPWGKIQSCQIRFSGSVKREQKRYLWLSLPSMQSAGSGTPIHYANWKDFGGDCLNRPVLITEGALKADVVAKFCPQFLIVANSGVGCAHDVIARITRGKKVSLAFDNDYHENPAVIRQLAKLILLISEFDGSKVSVKNTAILVWERSYKGIDDALLNAAKIVEVSLAEWICNLTTENRKIIEQTFFETLKSLDQLKQLL
jgi:hypothetical protein